MENHTTQHEEETPFTSPEYVIAFLAEGGDITEALRHIPLLMLRGASASALITILLYYCRLSGTWQEKGDASFMDYAARETQSAKSTISDSLQNLEMYLNARRSPLDFYHAARRIGFWAMREIRSVGISSEKLDKTVEYLSSNRLSREEIKQYLTTNGNSPSLPQWKTLRLPTELYNKLGAVMGDLREQHHLKTDMQALDALVTFYWSSVPLGGHS